MNSKPVWRPIRSIVIIEDDKEFSQTLTRMLGSLGYETTISTDAGFTFALRDDDMVFLDVMMPGISGFQVLDQLAQLGTKCPIVLISGTLERLESAEKYATHLDLNLIGALEKAVPIDRFAGSIGGGLGLLASRRLLRSASPVNNFPLHFTA